MYIQCTNVHNENAIQPCKDTAMNADHPLPAFVRWLETRGEPNQAAGPPPLPATLPDRMLLLSADSGITATLSMLRDLQLRHYQGDVVWLHVCRNPAELNQARALQHAADSYPELSLLVHFEDRAGQFCAEALTLAVPDVAERTTWLCGPSGFVDMVQAHWRNHGLTTPLHVGRCLTAPTPARQPVPA